MDIFLLIVGMVTGILASLIAWWISYRLLAPKLAFSDKIKKSPTENTNVGYYYQFKLGNLRKHTAAMDISLRVALYLPEFPVKNVTNIYTIPTDAADLFEISPNKKGDVGWSKRISLNIYSDDFLKHFNSTYFTDEFKDLLRLKSHLLEDLLSITPNAFVKVFVSAANSYSGSRRLFKSINYRISDIVEGKYERLSFKLIPYSSDVEAKKDYFISKDSRDSGTVLTLSTYGERVDVKSLRRGPGLSGYRRWKLSKSRVVSGRKVTE